MVGLLALLSPGQRQRFGYEFGFSSTSSATAFGTIDRVTYGGRSAVQRHAASRYRSDSDA